MSNDEGTQSDADVLGWIAFAGVIMFGIGMAYAIHTTNQVVQAVNDNHSKKIIIQSEETNVHQNSGQSGQNGTSSQY